jgi:carbonic anhydrase
MLLLLANRHGYEMAVHLVHADEKGNVAVVAVLLKKGADNALVNTLWKDLPKEKEKVESEKDVQIDADGLLPPDHSYYTFLGSRTTPPCSEDVTWFVLEHPVSVSATEIEQFSKLYRNDARPTQSLLWPCRFGKQGMKAEIHRGARWHAFSGRSIDLLDLTPR